jgi:hypothetical protein
LQLPFIHHPYRFIGHPGGLRKIGKSRLLPDIVNFPLAALLAIKQHAEG